MASDSPMGARQGLYEQRVAVWQRASELLADRIFTDNVSRTQTELELALFMVHE